MDENVLLFRSNISNDLQMTYRKLELSNYVRAGTRQASEFAR